MKSDLTHRLSLSPKILTSITSLESIQKHFKCNYISSLRSTFSDVFRLHSFLYKIDAALSTMLSSILFLDKNKSPSTNLVYYSPIAFLSHIAFSSIRRQYLKAQVHKDLSIQILFFFFFTLPVDIFCYYQNGVVHSFLFFLIFFSPSQQHIWKILFLPVCLISDSSTEPFEG